MKTAISIPDGDFDAAEQLAKRLRMSRSELYVKAIREYVRSHSMDRVTAALNEVYGAVDSSMDPGLERAQLEVLRRVEW